ncbi:MAG TPA: hypothetical protein VLH56_02585 [Dissulfurispiraceae bacterium]|nr:hypothetical protein [Dissulfurispiraceae bacterium]
MTQINRRLHLALGYKAHTITTDTNPDSDGWMWSVCSCGDKWSDHSIDKRHRNPDYCGDPRLVIEAMFAREDWIDFRDACITIYGDAIPVDLILDKTGELALLALEWLGQQEGGK